MKRPAASTESAPPDFLTVVEAAAVVRIGRTAAYEQARRYLATGGAPGLLPAVPFGKQFRVPRYKLEDYLGGPITWPPVLYEPAGTNAVAPITTPDPDSSMRGQRKSRTEQTVLPFFR
jgi:hypothetical protein